MDPDVKFIKNLTRHHTVQPSPDLLPPSVPPSSLSSQGRAKWSVYFGSSAKLRYTAPRANQKDKDAEGSPVLHLDPLPLPSSHSPSPFHLHQPTSLSTPQLPWPNGLLRVRSLSTASVDVPRLLSPIRQMLTSTIGGFISEKMGLRCYPPLLICGGAN